MIDGWGPNLIGNAQEPQTAPWAARAFGFGMVFAAVGLSTSTPAGAEYQFGTHQKAIYDSQFKGAIFTPPHPNIPGDAVKALVAAPQSYDFTLQAQFFNASVVINQSPAMPSEYHFGTHATQLANSQIASRIFPSLRQPPQVGGQVPLRSLHVQGQELTKDLTIQGWSSIPSVPQGWLFTVVSAGPQLADLTIQPWFQPAPIYNINAVWSPTTIISVMQADPWQRQAQVYKPSAVAVKPQSQPFISAYPTPSDPTQNQGSIIPSLSPPPSKVVQPAIILTFEQQYDKNLYPLVVTMPYIYVAPTPFTGFWVQAVSAGFYGGAFRTPGDVFLLASSADFSDSTVDYQVNSNNIGFGWMAPASTQQVFEWLQANGAPYLPPQDHLRRFIY